MSMLKEFREFAMRGNVVDLAIGVVIGGAFSKIVTSMVQDIIMPPLNLLTAKSGLEFSKLAVRYPVEMKKMTEDGQSITETVNYSILNYGPFLQSIVDFILIAACIFFVVKLMNSAKKKQETAPAAPPTPSEDILLLREIRDSLKK